MPDDKSPQDSASPDVAAPAGDSAERAGDVAESTRAIADGAGDAAEGAGNVAEGAGDAASAPATGGDADPARSRRARLAMLVGIAAAVGILVVLMIRQGAAPPTSGTTGSGRIEGRGAAIRAPAGPGLPGAGTGGAHLTGFVVDGAGLPVASAEISAEPERSVADRGSAADGDGTGSAGRAGGVAAGSAGSDGSAASAPSQDAAIAAGSGANRGDAGRSVVTTAPPTGTDGRFVLDGLAPGRYRVRVTGAGLLAAELRYVAVPSDEARIVVARQVAIEGSVTDGGKPVVNAQVGLRGDAIGGTIEMRTTATGGFRFENLPEGRYQLFAWQAALAARTVRVARLGAGPFGPVELRLEAAAIVVGRVIDREEGTGIAAAIELRPSGDDQAPRYARSGDDGVFRIEGVPNGRWIADAFAPGYVSPGGIELEAGRGVPELALARGGAIEGRVLDGDGHPIAGATVRSLAEVRPGGRLEQGTAEVSAEVDRDKLRRFSGRTAAPRPISAPSAQGSDPEWVARGELGVLVGPIPPIPPPGAQVAQMAVIVDPSLAGEPPPLPADPARASIWTTGADGVYRIRGLARSKVAILAAASGFAETRSAPMAIEPGQVVTGVDLVLTPGTLIIGKVTDQRGSPVTGAQVTATPLGDGARGGDTAGASLQAFTDDAGEYKLGPITGRVELHATAFGHGENRRTVALAVVRGTSPAERREDLVLVVADAIVAGILEDATGAAIAGAQLDVVGGVSDGRHATTAADGTFTLDLLPAGRLRLHISHPAYPPDDVEVTAAATDQARARLRLAIGGGVEGALLDAASGAPISSVTLAAAGLANALAEASTDKAGRWRLAPLRPGRWRIAIKLPGYLAHTRELDVPAAYAPGGTSVRDIRIELARGALLGGTVRDARGQRVAAAHVIAGAVTGGGPTCEGDTDGQGEFRIHDCPTGDLSVVVSKAATRGATRATVRAGDEVLSLALELR